MARGDGDPSGLARRSRVAEVHGVPRLSTARSPALRTRSSRAGGGPLMSLAARAGPHKPMKIEVLKGHGDSANGSVGRGLPSLAPPGRAEEGHSRAPRVTRVVLSFLVGVRGWWSARSRPPQRGGSPGEQSCGSEAFADTSPVCVTRRSRATMRTWLGEGESICLQTSQPSLCSLEHTLCVCPSARLRSHATSWVLMRAS